MKRYRCSMQIIAAYLELATATKCERMENAEVSYRCGSKYHDLLVERGFLKPVKSTLTYRTTKKGWFLLGLIASMLDMLGLDYSNAQLLDRMRAEQKIWRIGQRNKEVTLSSCFDKG